MDFKLVSDYAPMGDQPEAIEQLVGSIRHGSKHNTLLGVTGSGKTFTVANVVAQLNRPTLVLSHNKTLAAQLYGEFKTFFPENAVEYFVSYYDYYQPEAYLPSTDTYIEKDLSINAEIEKLRLRTVATLLSGRRDVIVVSSVSCLYGAGNPADFHATAIDIKVGQIVSYKHFLYKLVEALYTRTERELEPATFRVNGDTVDIMAAFGEFGNVAWGWIVVALFLIRELGITVMRFFVMEQPGGKVIAAAWPGKLKTVFQCVGLSLLLVPLWTLAPGTGPNPWWLTAYTWLTQIVIYVALVLCLYSGAIYLINTFRKPAA